jgi:hypothetical protein
VVDQWSVTETFNFQSRFIESDAHAKAIKLADFVKKGTDGVPIELTASGVPEIESEEPIDVVPVFQQDNCVTLEYPAGMTNHVIVDIDLSRVSDAAGSAAESPGYQSPTDTGNGPIKLVSPNGLSGEFVEDVTVSRIVGRPNSSVNKSTDQYPYWIDKKKSAYDGWEIAFKETTAANPSDVLETIIKMFRQRPNDVREPYRLDFQGEYGLGEFKVAPDGSDALRTVRKSAEEGIVNVPAVNLRVVRE